MPGKEFTSGPAASISKSPLTLWSDFGPEGPSGLERIQYRALLVVSKSPKVPYCPLLKQYSLSVQHDELCFKFGMFFW